MSAGPKIIVQDQNFKCLSPAQENFKLFWTLKIQTLIKVSRVWVCVNSIHNMNPLFFAARHIWGFFGGQQGQAWFTHFSVLIEFQNGSMWIIERVDSGVLAMDCGTFAGFESYRYPLKCWQAEDACQTVTANDVHNFLENQKGMGFSLLSKNCKHFAHDFYHCVLHANPGQFHTWAHQIEYEYLHYKTPAHIKKNSVHTFRAQRTLLGGQLTPPQILGCQTLAEISREK
jgi:hypothetical protein